MVTHHFFKVLAVFIGMLLFGIVLLFAINHFGSTAITTEDIGSQQE